MSERHCVLHGTLRRWPHDDELVGNEWVLTPDGSHEPLTCWGGGASGSNDGTHHGASLRFEWEFGYRARPAVLRITNALFAVNIEVTLAIANAVPTAFTYSVTESRPRLGELIAAVWRSGAGHDAIPLSVMPLEAEPIATEFGAVVPLVLERWRGCDVVGFALQNLVDIHELRVIRTTPNGVAEHGVPLGGSGGANGFRMDLAFPDLTPSGPIRDFG